MPRFLPFPLASRRRAPRRLGALALILPLALMLALAAPLPGGCCGGSSFTIWMTPAAMRRSAWAAYRTLYGSRHVPSQVAR
jgi:hypothetical protein